MSSILTNTSSMVALQTLRSTNKNLATVQNEISTGLKVSNAKDNASTWAIAQTMRSDVGAFEQLSDSLATGLSAVGVARTAAETVTDLLDQMKEKIVASQSSSADRNKLQADVNELRSQIESVVAAAQFNGLNLVNGENTAVDVLASLDRDSDGNVTARNISVAAQNLSLGSGGVGIDPAISGPIALADGSGGATTDDITFDVSGSDGVNRVTIDVDGTQVEVTAVGGDNDTFAAAVAAAINGAGLTNLTASAAADGSGTVTFSNTDPAARAISATGVNLGTAPIINRTGGVEGGSAVADGSPLTLSFDAASPGSGSDSIVLNVGGTTLSVDVELDGTTDDEDRAAAVASALNSAIADGRISGMSVAVTGADVVITSDPNSAQQNIKIGGYHDDGQGLSVLNSINVADSTGAMTALDAIEGLMTTAIDAAAALGSSQKRIEIQNDFVSKLIDAVNTGIGSMVDANMEEASARLTALQTQQQLGIQSLSIANQAPQTLLSLFR